MITYLTSKGSLLVIILISYFLFKYQTSNIAKRTFFPFNQTFSTRSAFPKSTLFNFTPPSPIDPHEKYLTFFTHSGFQNQLIQVENGILLAWYLNRTLILPKAILGEAFGWNQFEKLQLHHTVRDKNNHYCKQFKDKKSKKKASCPDPFKYALASFDELIDLSWAKQHVKIVQREKSDFLWLQQQFDIKKSPFLLDEQTTGTYVDGDILFFKDKTRYDWRIYDVPVKHRFLGRYVDSLDATQLRNHTERLIHFTSLFGTGKFPIKKPENQAFFKALQKSMVYKHPAVLKIADIVIDALGGPGNFVGAHLRTADGLFVKAIPENIQHLIDRIPVPNSERHALFSLDTCVEMVKANQTALVFLATDAVQPRKDKRFRDLWHHLPCTFTLDDILSKDHPSWRHMDQYRVSHTGQSMRKYLIPLVDALVASQGTSFVGTRGSTFSGYIKRLHQNLLE
ncbi:uncharacterized protein B0P05DRAFT_97966 [Gilbertella persicaria]|uniref:uncharacterized protein n=1 Tax=Gilbertella persicaria TaxID=101096 RepID=UPI00221F0D84|nr:uncharacterized protein B0P05DRAFT_97966 [Gilbertella persicaria]KAI8097964.1 hypothetical protein B0P05DRAFT_97966 [Gilbertella persicaria]